MKTSFLEQVAKALKDRNNRTRWLSIVLCLALTVSTGTFYAFMRPGQAKNRTAKVLACQFEVHKHSEDCLDEDGNLICGKANYVLHTHNDDCYDTKGNLVCRLPEVEYLSEEEPEEPDRSEAGDKSEEEPDSSEAPDKSGEPEDTEAPDKSEEPGDTETPDKAEKPSKAETPDKSETPSDSEEPGDVEEPSDPEDADKGEVPDGSNDSKVPEQADAADDAGTSDKGDAEEPSESSDASDDAETPSEPEQPTEADTADDGGDSGDAEASAEPGEDVVADDSEDVAADGEDAEAEEEIFPWHRHDESCYDEDEELICGLEEEEVLPPHEHDEDCFDEDGNLVCGEVEVLEHVHGPECFITITLDEDEADYTCGKIGHTHEDVCYNEAGDLICPLEEHKHSEICLLTKAGWQCGKEEHAHSEACYDEQGELVCGLEEHEHSAECAIPAQVEEPSEWLCGKDAHTHGEECYNENGELICGVEEHEHDASCLIAVEWKCGLEEHVHSEACYDEQGELVCGLEEHAHTLECLDEAAEWPCGKVAHVHGADCYDGNGALVCELEEHEHTEACLVMPELVELDDDYGYVTENGWFDIVFHVSGTVLVPKETEDEEIDLVFTVDALNEGSEYDLFVQEGERLEEKLLGVLTVGMKNGEKEVDLTDCEITAAITPTEQLRMDAASQLMTPVEEQEGTEGASEETVLRLTAREADADANVNELDSVYLPETKKTEAPAEDPAAPVDPAESVDPAAPVESADQTAPADDSVVSPEASPEAPADPIANDETTEPVDDEDSNDNSTEPADGETTIPDGDSSEPVDGDTTVTGEDSNDNANLGEKQTLNFTVKNNTFGVYGARGLEPSFTVEYYAYLDRLDISTEKINKSDYSGYVALDLINTKGGKLPVNGTKTSNPRPEATKKYDVNGEYTGNDYEDESYDGMLYLYVDKTPNGSEVNGSVKYKSQQQLTKIFQERSYPLAIYQYYGADKWDIFATLPDDKVHYNDNPELWIYKGSGDTADENNWIKKEQGINNLTFTHIPESESETCIYLGANKRFRLVYTPKPDSTFDNPVAFYDYDITDGKIYSSEADAQDVIKAEENLRNAKTEAEKQTALTQLENARNQGAATSTQGSSQVFANTYKQGINSDGNYADNGKTKLGFGNDNTVNGLSQLKWGSSYWLNMRNVENGKITRKTGTFWSVLDQKSITYTKTSDWRTGIIQDLSFKGCTFGLATSLTNGMIEFNKNIDAPNLFNGNSQHTEGKTFFDGSLSFIRKGDTYTLTRTSVKNPTKENPNDVKTVENLDKFKYKYVRDYESVYYPNIYSNEFWPLDGTTSHGTDNHDLKFGDESLESNRMTVGKKNGAWFTTSFPTSDFQRENFKDHNCYFGMNFAVDFTLTEDYCGPLEYVFFGDDDMWVFLSDDNGQTGRLICDIGGVHSTVGEYVDLWDYVDCTKDVAGNITSVTPNHYSLYFFYTERGASGSTCWMQFTLPQVSANQVKVDIGKVTNTLKVGKEVTSGGDEDKAFEFIVNIQLPEDANKASRFNYIRFHADGSSYGNSEWIKDGDRIQLKHKEHIEIYNLPTGSRYTVTEVPSNSYQLQWTGTEVKTDGNGQQYVEIQGPVNEGGDINVNLVNRYCPEMPATGGEGPWLYSVVGTGFMVMAAGIYLVTRRVRVKAK